MAEQIRVDVKDKIHSFLNQPESAALAAVKQLMRTVVVTYPYEEYSREKSKNIADNQELLENLVDRVLANPIIAEAVMEESVLLLTYLGQASRWFGHYRQSLQFLERAREILRATESSAATVPLLRELGRVKFYLNENQNSRFDLADALERELFANVKNDLLIARIHADLSLTLTKDPAATFEQALTQAQRGLEVLTDSLTPESIDRDLAFAEVHRAIAICQRWLNRREAAKDHFMLAADLFTQSLGQNHPTVLGIYHNIGILGFVEGFEEFVPVGISAAQSRLYIEAALESDQTEFGEQHPLSIIALQWLSQMMYVQDDLLPALETRQRVIELWTAINGPDSLDLIYSYYWLGRILEKLNDKLNEKPNERLSETLGKELTKKLSEKSCEKSSLKPANQVGLADPSYAQRALDAYERVCEIAEAQSLENQISYYSDHATRARHRIDEIAKIQLHEINS